MPLGLYLHYPFCRNRCHYCDFYKTLHNEQDESRYFAALTIETELAAAEYGLEGRRLSSIYIGGGTPSLADVRHLSRWIESVGQIFDYADDLEFSIESNPESVTIEKLRGWRELGVNRPVFGVQSFNRDLLAGLGRRHSPHDSHKAIYQTGAIGYRNFGVDLIFGWPGQTTKMLSADLDHLLALQPPHISFYQLTVEPGTTLWDMVSDGSLEPPTEEPALAMYRGGSEQMITARYERYEVSSFSRPGFACRHNLGYWLGHEYLGLGPSAHSFVAGRRFANPCDLVAYMDSLQAGNLPAQPDESGAQERMTEAIMLGFRLAQGISRKRFAEQYGHSVQSRLNSEQYGLLIDGCYLIEDGDYLRLSDKGLYLADEITRRLLA
ncbi:MAG: radical SAM family heme chaperone HemW [bacterium]